MKTVSERDIDRLVKILDYCDKIKECRRFVNDSYDAFADNVIYQDAAQMSLFQIGEQANHLSDECIEQMGEIPWYQIIGLRNRIAHGYETVQSNQIWDIMTKDIPELKDAISRFLVDIGEGDLL